VTKNFLRLNNCTNYLLEHIHASSNNVIGPIVWNILLKHLLMTYCKDLVTVLLTGQASEP